VAKKIADLCCLYRQVCSIVPVPVFDVKFCGAGRVLRYIFYSGSGARGTGTSIVDVQYMGPFGLCRLPVLWLSL
jgi:hypothetical protein